MSIRVKIEGLKELQASIRELGKATGRNVMRRALLKAAEPLVEAAASNAPVRTGFLREDIEASTRLTKSARRNHGKLSPTGVEVYVGPGAAPRGIMQEFGTIHHPPQPFLRPAFDATHGEILSSIREDLKGEIEGAFKRRAKKLAKHAAKAGAK
jgi:HK97 gp10 family phage protein